MSDFNGALAIVLGINVILFMAQISINEVNPDIDFG